MPSASRKSLMSLEELAICEGFLDSHREYAIDLLFNIEKIRQWHGTDSCSKTRDGRTCTVCELCSADGLLGATKQALVSYSDVEKHLQRIGASLEKSVPSCSTPALHSRTLLPKVSPRAEVPGREALLLSSFAKAVFLSTVTVGATLRSQHATWQARLQSELATSPASAQSPGRINTSLGNMDQNDEKDTLLPTYSDSRFVGPETNLKLTEVSNGLLPETTGTPSSSMFIVFRRCLSSDCPCEANRTNAASNSNFRDTCGPQVATKVPLPLSNSKQTRASKAIAKLDVATRGGGNHAAQFTTKNPEEHGPPSPISETALLTQEIETPLLSPEWIVDSRVSRLRAQIARSDEARRALMKWCRAWTADDPWGKHGTGAEASLTQESTLKGQVAKTATDGLSHGDETTAQEPRFNSEQEELKEQWLMARRKRCEDKKRRPTLV